jgi:hypothetical protein
MDIFLDSTLRALNYLARTLPLIVLGVFVASLLAELKLINKIAFIASPMTRFAHMKRETGVSFLTAFFSPSIANGMLAQYNREGRLQGRETLLAAVLNSFPAYVYHIWFLIPVVVPLLHWVGVLYIMVIAAIGVVKTLIILLAANIMLDSKEEEGVLPREERPAFREALKEAVTKSRSLLKRLILTIVPLVLVSFILAGYGAFEALSSHLTVVTEYLHIPGEATTVIGAYVVSPVAGYSVASSLLEGGMDSMVVLVSLMMGVLISNFVGALRHTGPYYLGIFGVELGTRIVVVSTLLRGALQLVAITLILVFWL